ncbi:short-chain dehydrogenase [Haloferula helveola]|uniref:Short-chain dehydrogenase n=1 Tax=Haloferula helveola TaxID=490095 RepID=A0ABN6H744_9BACT|nr:short-chain dehydrogenase [Haloferula helveola]
MKHVLITGATRGLGRALALGFADSGWAVSGCGTSAHALDALTTDLGDPHLVRVCDVTSSAAVERFVDEAVALHGPPDLLINNAALINANAPLWKVPPEEFSKVIDVNLKGIHHMIRAALPPMLERGSGIIVNLSSGWGRSTSPEVAPYCCTKWGVEGLTLALAQELPKGLAAIPLNPGIIDTDMLRSCFGEGASDFPDAKAWAETAVPFLQKLTPSANGQSLTVG